MICATCGGRVVPTWKHRYVPDDHDASPEGGWRVVSSAEAEASASAGALDAHTLTVGGYGVHCSCGTYFDGFDNPRPKPSSVKAYPDLYRDETLGEHLLRAALAAQPAQPAPPTEPRWPDDEQAVEELMMALADVTHRYDSADARRVLARLRHP